MVPGQKRDQRKREEDRIWGMGNRLGMQLLWLWVMWMLRERWKWLGRWICRIELFPILAKDNDKCLLRLYATVSHPAYREKENSPKHSRTHYTHHLHPNSQHPYKSTPLETLLNLSLRSVRLDGWVMELLVEGWICIDDEWVVSKSKRRRSVVWGLLNEKRRIGKTWWSWRW